MAVRRLMTPSIPRWLSATLASAALLAAVTAVIALLEQRESWSVPFRVWLPWASYFTGGVAFHGYPEVPAYPASHGCVRIPLTEASTVYGFARVGVPVRVVS